MIFFFWFATSDLKAGKVMSNKNIIIKWQIICAHDNGHPLLKAKRINSITTSITPLNLNRSRKHAGLESASHLFTLSKDMFKRRDDELQAKL